MFNRRADGMYVSNQSTHKHSNIPRFELSLGLSYCRRWDDSAATYARNLGPPECIRLYKVRHYIQVIGQLDVTLFTCSFIKSQHSSPFELKRLFVMYRKKIYPSIYV